jgi:hypothetical protein
MAKAIALRVRTWPFSMMAEDILGKECDTVFNKPDCGSETVYSEFRFV